MARPTERAATNATGPPVRAPEARSVVNSTALRYVERNPMRARLARRAENYSWSSAAAHCGRRADPVLTKAPAWRDRLADVADWSGWLAERDEAEEVAVLRRNVDKGLPCGSAAFIDRLEALADRPLRFRPIGRPRTREDLKDTG